MTTALHYISVFHSGYIYFVPFTAGTCPTKPVLSADWLRKLVQIMDTIEYLYLPYSRYRVKPQSISHKLNSAQFESLSLQVFKARVGRLLSISVS